MRRISHIFFSAALLGVFAFPLHAQTRSVSLPQWTLELKERTFTVMTVPWDRPVSKGGAGIQAEGTGMYRCVFTVPEFLRGTQLAFFVSSIDDADRTRLNGVTIGETGRFPEPALSDFRSGFREPRLYVIPQNLLRGGENELRIEVFNFAGSGGFNGDEPPVIAPYGELSRRAERLRLGHDGVRISLLTALMCTFAGLVCLVVFYGTKQSVHYALRRAILSFRIDSLVRKVPRPKYDFKGEVIFRTMMNGVIVICFAFFTLTETTFRTGIVGSESFWFKATEIALYTAFLGIIAIFHADIFGTRLPEKISPAHRAVRMLLKTATHPGILSLFLAYLIVLPVRKSWEIYVSPGTPLMLCVLSIVFVLSSIRLIRFAVTSDRSVSAVFIRSASARIVFTAGFIAAIAIFHSGVPAIYANTSILVMILVLFYVISSFLFFIRHRTVILQAEDSATLEFQLHDRYDLTPSEVRISTLIAEGASRDGICRRTGITPSTLKIHLKSIYTKTIETGQITKDGKAGKFQRLTIFLHSLERSDAQ